MSDRRKLELQMKPGIRWSILRTLHIGGHIGATEAMVQRVVHAEYFGTTDNQIRDELHYLSERKLITIERSEIEGWRMILTRVGFDLVEYRVECEPGIDRPPLPG